MSLDIYTLYICELYILGFLSVINVFTWLGSRCQKESGFMAVILALTMSAVWLANLRHFGYQFLPVAVANFLVLLSYGLLVNILRSLGDRPLRSVWLLLGLIWPLLCLLPDFYHSPAARILVISLLCALYSVAFFLELCRLKHKIRTTFWPAITLVSIHMVFQLLRILLDNSVPDTRLGAITGTRFSLYVMLESILFVIGLTFTLLAMINERSQARLAEMALRDPLTGTLNRRGFTQEALKLMQRCYRQQLPCSVMVFDLDHFKAVNDTFGHGQGDEVLQAFTERTSGLLPQGVCFARLGGEEFIAVAILSQGQALALCEQVRQAAEYAHRHQPVACTVSAGIVSSLITEASPLALSLLTDQADSALYQAKRQGRNSICVYRVSTYLSREVTE